MNARVRGALIAFGIIFGGSLSTFLSRSETGEAVVGLSDIAFVAPALLALLAGVLFSSDVYQTWRRNRVQRKARAWMDAVERG